MTETGAQADRGGPCRAARLGAALLVATVLIASARAGEPGDTGAAAVVERLQSGLLDIDRRRHDAGSGAREAAFAPLIASTHDLDYMARLSIGAGWQALSRSQQARFSEVFRRLSVLGYATRFRDTGGGEFRIERVRNAPGGRVSVVTQFTAPPDSPVRLDYLLRDTDSGWRIVNVLADGVSELALQRTQYRDILARKGFDGLIDHLEDRIAAMLEP